MAFEIVQIAKDDETIRAYVDRFKEFRLYSLKTSPESFGSTYAREVAFTDTDWYGRLRNPKAFSFIALQSGRIVSTIVILGPLPFPPEELSPHGNPWVNMDGDAAVKIPTTSHWRINAMFTLPEARGQGIAKAIIEAAKVFGVTQTKASGQDLVLSIVVNEDNIPAKSLYERCGFVSIKEKTYHDESRIVLLMKWSPGSS